MNQAAAPIITRAGFTIVELIIGMTITTLTLGALASFTFSVGRAWQTSADQSEVAAVVNVTSARLTKVVSTARAAGALRNGSFDNSAPAAAVLLWREDTNHDREIQVTELAALAYDPASKCLRKLVPAASAVEATLTMAQFHDDATLAGALAGFDSSPLIPQLKGMRLFCSNTTSATAAVVEAQIRPAMGDDTFTIVCAMRSAAME